MAAVKTQAKDHHVSATVVTVALRLAVRRVIEAIEESMMIARDMAAAA